MGFEREPEDPRRRLLLAALSAGLFTAGPGAVLAFFHKRKTPNKLPEGQSIHQLKGNVLINGAPASMETVVRAGDSVATGADGQAIFAVGQDAFLLRASSRIETSGEGFLVEQLRLLTGRLLSVFGKTRHRVETPIASVGIRGTGLYVETDPERSYVCTCYGMTELAALTDPSSAETIASEHHDQPRYILSSGDPGTRIRPAPVINHTDAELTLIEALVGRVPPFGPNANRYEREVR
jgi:hypothetical protein